MAWQHRRIHNYDEYTYEAKRTLGNREVRATATVVARNSDNDTPANWEIMHDGNPVRNGHADTLKQAKKDAFAALWKPRMAKFARKVR